MAKNYRYICTVGVRPIGAEGVYRDVDFSVVMPTATATASALFSQWQQLLGDELQPYVLSKVNGQPTAGMIDHSFPGEEV
jgi:hypothetical protein